jgi:hypothetical protein
VAFAEGDERFPAELFGIRIGAVYQFREDGAHTLPVAKVTGVQKLSPGINIYFEPFHKSPTFPYVELREEGIEHFKSSHRLYALPVFPDDTTALENPTDVGDYKIIRIDWSDIDQPAKPRSDAFFWAVDFCKAVAGDLRLDPVITNYGWYECTFGGRDLEMTVSSEFGRNIRLSYRPEITDDMERVVESVVRQMEIERVRPYTFAD